ncbi:hypothetical protein AZE42_09984 [Rhizopogon vesiculosus]|uniref:Reverse transcriptase zinc-binding domain-containing protein n=1 Tax=Rhizopogon vesiculosus TaxID=180088 RepID=A0A1J8QQX1_9AGAM|nr:hypothetical protein AZE42_09984 [Rhizopogon vesiculosus]
MILAVDLLREEGGKGTLALGVDDQAAIKTMGAFNPKAGHYLMDILHGDMRRLIPTHYQPKLIVRWSPGLQAIPGNEAAGLPRRHSPLLFQLRTGHAPLNKHLYRITKVPSPTCQHCNLREETVHHFLIACPSYARQRHKLQEEIGPRTNQLKKPPERPKVHQTTIPLHSKHPQTEPGFTLPSDDDDG